MVKHIVMFKLTGTDAERLEVAKKFKAALEALPAAIDVLQSIEVGLNQNPSEQWDVVLTAIVPTMADVATYANHPAHLAAAGLLRGQKENRVCGDEEFEGKERAHPDKKRKLGPTPVGFGGSPPLSYC